jgi:hypothetical protein
MGCSAEFVYFYSDERERGDSRNRKRGIGGFEKVTGFDKATTAIPHVTPASIIV